jgi:hypothetical protein
MSINYLVIYKQNHSLPVGLVEFHSSVGNSKARNLRWHKDLLQLSKSNKLETDLEYLNLYGYLSKVKDLNRLPRNLQGNILSQYVPKRIKTSDLINILVEYNLS